MYHSTWNLLKQFLMTQLPAKKKIQIVIAKFTFLLKSLMDNNVKFTVINIL